MKTETRQACGSVQPSTLEPELVAKAKQRLDYLNRRVNSTNNGNALVRLKEAVASYKAIGIYVEGYME